MAELADNKTKEVNCMMCKMLFKSKKNSMGFSVIDEK